jgi:murein DD-endopeptidase MepM/ murein hydrolase activator NlpD
MTPKVESVPSQAANNEADPQLHNRKLAGETEGSQKLIYPQLKCRFRKSAAMMGLAISLGASSLLLSQIGDEAIAAEPMTAKSNSTPKIPAPLGQQLPTDIEDLRAIAASQNVEASFALPDRTHRKILTANNAIGQTQQPAANNSPISVPVEVPGGQLLENQPTFTNKGNGETVESVQPESNDVAGSDAEELAKTSIGQVQQPTPEAIQTEGAAAAEIPVTILPEGVGSGRVNSQQSPDTVGVSEEQQLTSSNANTKPAAAENKSATPLLPKATVSQPEAVEPVAVYQVQRGDTLSGIAQTYGISIAELLRMNNLKAADRLEINQQLIVPAKKSTASATNAPVESSSGADNSLDLAALDDSATANIAIAVNKPLASPKPAVYQGSNDRAEAFAVAPQPNPTASEGSNSAAPAEGNQLQTEISQLRERYLAQAQLSQSNTSTQGAPGIAIPIVAPPNNSRSLSSDRPPANVGPNSLSSREEAVEISVPQPISNNRIQRTAPAAVRPVNYSRPTSPLRFPANNRQPQQFNRQPATVRPSNFGSQEVAAIEIPVPVPASNVIPRRRSQIASAPIPTDGYNPMLQTPAGQPVSPQLPAGNLPRFNGLIWPAKGVLTSGYGMRWGRMHKGIDIAGPVGTPIFAAGPGIVLRSGWNSSGYGNLVEIQHPDGTITRYGHNSRLAVQAGQQVEQGQLIALMGSTGRSTGPHCHFEVRPGGGDAVNPMSYLPRRS